MLHAALLVVIELVNGTSAPHNFLHPVLDNSH